MPTVQDAINETQRLLAPINRSITVSLSQNYTAGGTSISFTDQSPAGVNALNILPGTVLSVDLELMLVLGVPSGGSVSVMGGYLGSTPANHSIGALVYSQRKFTDFECLQQINHVLDELGGEGLYHLAECSLIFNPTIQAYDLTDVNTSVAVTNFIEGVALRYRTPAPDRKYRTIPQSHWEVLPFASTTVEPYFPSGYSLILNDSAYPGQPMLFLYKQGFSYATGYTSDLQTTCLLPPTANDLLPMGATIRMVPPREVQRNQTQAQPDGRLAPEVPPGAVAGSVNAVRATYIMRIGEELGRLKQQVGSLRRRY